MNPGNPPGGVDTHRSRHATEVVPSRFRPVLSKAGASVFQRASYEIAREEGEDRGRAQPCGAMRAPFGIGDTGIGDPVASAECRSRRCIGGDHDIDASVALRWIGLAQLRERLTEERSTGMSRPNDECGELDRPGKEFERGGFADGKTFSHAPGTGASRKRLSSSRSVRSIAIGVILTKPWRTAPISQSGSSLSSRPGRFQTR